MMATETLRHNRAALIVPLKEHSIDTSIVIYSGAGDSGYVDGVETLPQKA